jgi:hypothetical protein
MLVTPRALVSTKLLCAAEALRNEVTIAGYACGVATVRV